MYPKIRLGVRSFLLLLCGAVILLAQPAYAIPATPETSPLATPDPNEPTIVPFDPVERALFVTNERFPGITDQPQVLYAAPIAASQFATFGLSERSFAGGAPPMAYVLLKGDFDVSDEGVGMPVGFDRAQYIAYVVDPRAGAMTSILLYEDTTRIADVLQRLGIPIGTATPAPSREPSP